MALAPMGCSSSRIRSSSFAIFSWRIWVRDFWRPSSYSHSSARLALTHWRQTGLVASHFYLNERAMGSGDGVKSRRMREPTRDGGMTKG